MWQFEMLSSIGFVVLELQTKLVEQNRPSPIKLYKRPLGDTPHLSLRATLLLQNRQSRCDNHFNLLLDSEEND